MNTYKQLEAYGQSLIGKTCQSKLLTQISHKGTKILRAPMKITGYEIVTVFLEPALVVILDDDAVFEDTCINFK